MASHGARHGSRDSGDGGTKLGEGQREEAKGAPDLVGARAKEAGAGRSGRRRAVLARGHPLEFASPPGAVKEEVEMRDGYPAEN
jgi:hypothetical protein